MLPIDPALAGLVARLGWDLRPTGVEGETCLGDHAHGYLLLDRGEYIQLARRAVKGDPSLKLWSPDVTDLQRYVAFNAGLLVRHMEGLAPVHLPVDEAAIPEAFTLVRDESSNVFLTWSVDGIEHWAGFGTGNEFIAVQFSQYALRSIEDIVDDILAPNAPERFPAAPSLQKHRTSDLSDEQIRLLAQYLRVDEQVVIDNHGVLPEDDAIFAIHPVRGGAKVIIAADGSALWANSSQSFDEQLRAFRAGRRTPPEQFTSVGRAPSMHE